jgi:hypothetical protein
MNIEADRLATLALWIPQKSPLHFPHLFLATPQINDQNVSSKHTLHLRVAHHSIKLGEHYKMDNFWSDHTYDNVWWNPHGSAMYQLPIGERNT